MDPSQEKLESSESVRVVLSPPVNVRRSCNFFVAQRTQTYERDIGGPWGTIMWVQSVPGYARMHAAPV